MIFRSLKFKLIFWSSLLIIFVIAGLSSVFIYSRVQEYSEQIYTNGRSFADIITPQISQFNDLYLQEGSFFNFNKEIKNIFNKDSDLESIAIYSYQGKVLYDSKKEKIDQYQGPDRYIEDKNLLYRLKSHNISVELQDGTVIFLKKNSSGSYTEIDISDEVLEDFNISTNKIKDIIVPFDSKIAVKYIYSYDALDKKLKLMIYESFLITIFGLILSFIFSYFFSSKIVRPLKNLTQAVLNISEGDLKKRVNVETKDEVGVLANAFNHMAIQLDQSTKAMAFQQRVSKEFELASDIQRRILPKDIPQVEFLDIAAGLIPAEAVGGDLFDFMKVDEDNTIMYLGDVTGHGVPSGLVVSIANAVLFSHIDEKDMKKILCRANVVLKAKTLPNMFLTLLMMNWNSKEQKMTYISAGHEQMIYYSSQDKKVMLLPGGGMALGMIPDISKILKVNEVTLNKGDLLVTYSDGIPECWKNEKDMYGIARFKNLIAEIGDLGSAEAIKNAIIADVKMYAAGYEQKDDITVMVVKKI